MTILKVVLRRFSRLILTIFIASTAVFFLLRVIPGDPARIIAGVEGAKNAQVLEQIRTRLGLDQPLIVQYLQWIGGSFSGDFGSSYQSDTPVITLLAERLPVTLGIAVLGMLIALMIAVPAGIISASNRRKPTDHVIMGSSHILLAIPEFWLGIVLLLFFGVYIPVFPLFGSSSLLHFILPALALGLGRAAFLARLVRTSVLREFSRDYVQFLSQLEVPRRRLLFRHILPNAMIPIAIPAAIQFGYLLGGAIIIEQVFGMGGTGRLLLQAIQMRDFPLIQGTVIMFAVIFSMVNFAADFLVILADPRSRI